MTEPLSVDPSRLAEIGQILAGLAFPKAPSPMTVPGSDPVSAAINATMPNLESLVSDGLPGVKAALTRTASNMSTAAEIYTKADQSLGDTLRQAVFGAGGQGLAGVASNVPGQFSSLMGATSLDNVQLPPEVSQMISELAPRVEATVPQLVQFAPTGVQMATQAAPMMMSTVTQFAGQGASGASQGAAAPASLVSDTKKDGEDQDQQSDTEDRGAAAGAEGTGSAPTHRGTGGTASPTITTV